MNEYMLGLFVILAVIVTQCDGNNGKTLLDVAVEAGTCAKQP